MCRPAAHRERRASLVSEKRDGEVGALFGRLERTPAFPGGAAGAHSAHKAGAGAFGPRPCFGFAGPPGRQNTAAPRRNPTAPRTPAPAHLRRPCGGCLGGAGRSGQACGGRRRLAAVGWPCGPPHGLPNKRAGPWAFGPGPRSFRTLRVPPPPPPPGFPPTPKRQRKLQPRSAPPGKRW